MQERRGKEKKSELHSVAKGVRHGSTLSSATFCLTFWSKMQELLFQPVMGSYADDVTVSSDDDEADSLWDETAEALKETRYVRGRSGTTEHSLSRSRLSHWAPRRLNGTRRQLTKTTSPWLEDAWKRRTNLLGMSRQSNSSTLTR